MIKPLVRILAAVALFAAAAANAQLTIEITGANDKAVKAYMAGLDFVRLEKQ